MNENGVIRFLATFFALTIFAIILMSSLGLLFRVIAWTFN